MPRLRLFTPGPTMIPPEVTAAMAAPMDHHRTAGHRRLFSEITLMMVVRKALEMIRAEGIENVWRRTARLARATRAAAEAMNLRVFAKDPTDSLTAILLPDGFDEPAFRRRLRDEHGIVVAGGQDQLKGRVFRINHMGYVDDADTLAALGAIELVLTAMAHRFPPGAGLAAAVKALSESRPF